jgi:predicted AAA+ superfamily ATPase
VHGEALRWALARSSRSGRTARQFVDDLAGREGLAARGR